jgi:hypothetical protein
VVLHRQRYWDLCGSFRVPRHHGASSLPRSSRSGSQNSGNFGALTSMPATARVPGPISFIAATQLAISSSYNANSRAMPTGRLPPSLASVRPRSSSGLSAGIGPTRVAFPLLSIYLPVRTGCSLRAPTLTTTSLPTVSWNSRFQTWVTGGLRRTLVPAALSARGPLPRLPVLPEYFRATLRTPPSHWTYRSIKTRV